MLSTALLLCIALASCGKATGIPFPPLQYSLINVKKLSTSSNRKTIFSTVASVLRIRAGSAGHMQTGIPNFNIHGPARSPPDSQNGLGHRPTDVLVSTSFGSSFLDKKKKLVMNSNDTVLDLKMQLSTKFPGMPPVALQNLYYSSRLLNDDELVRNISTLSPLPLVLDMMSGTSVYNRSMSVTQALDAYVATIVQQSYLGAQLQRLYTNSAGTKEHLPLMNTTDGVGEGTMQTVYYRQLYAAVNQSIYERYAVDITAALEAEKDPESIVDDTRAWRERDPALAAHYVNPLAAALAKEFDLNWRGLRHFAYYSVILAIFAFFGTNTASSTRVLLCMIPALWISKLRQLRLLTKIATYLVLPVLPYVDFLLPLFPAPFQVIAHESVQWDSSAPDGGWETGEDEGKGEDSHGITGRYAAEIRRSAARWSKKMRRQQALLHKTQHRTAAGSSEADEEGAGRGAANGYGDEAGEVIEEEDVIDLGDADGEEDYADGDDDDDDGDDDGDDDDDDGDDDDGDGDDDDGDDDDDDNDEEED